MGRISFLILILGFSTLINGQMKDRSSAIDDAPGKDEYEIYAVLAKEWFGGKDFRTITAIREVNGCMGATRNIDPEHTKIPQLKFAQITADCLDKTPAQLTAKRLTAGKKVILLSRKEMKALFADDCETGWKKFYKQYPKSTGQIYFSRVGFDDERKFAALSFGFQRECLFGEGYVIFLEKAAGGWRTIYKHSTWVS